MGKGTFYGLSMKTPVIYAEIQVLLMYSRIASLLRYDDKEITLATKQGSSKRDMWMRVNNARRSRARGETK